MKFKDFLSWFKYRYLGYRPAIDIHILNSDLLIQNLEWCFCEQGNFGILRLNSFDKKSKDKDLIEKVCRFPTIIRARTLNKLGEERIIDFSNVKLYYMYHSDTYKYFLFFTFSKRAKWKEA